MSFIPQILKVVGHLDDKFDFSLSWDLKFKVVLIMNMVMFVKENLPDDLQDIREFQISQHGRGRERLETIHFNYIV